MRLEIRSFCVLGGEWQPRAHGVVLMCNAFAGGPGPVGHSLTHDIRHILPARVSQLRPTRSESLKLKKSDQRCVDA